MNFVDSEFEQLIAALRPWMGELVVIGGWAHRMHHHHPLASIPGHAPQTTRDADVAFGTDATLKGDIKQALVEAGFREKLFREKSSTVAQYHIGTDDEGFYVEFLAPRSGNGIRRRDATISRGGVSAQTLAHLEILFVEPWAIRIGGPGSSSLPEPVNVRIANPVAFVVQKLLIHDLRAPKKKAQDLLYLHDTIQLFGNDLGRLNALWRDQVAPALSSGQRHAVGVIRQRVLGGVTDDIRAAVRIPADRSLKPEAFRAACERGLAELLDAEF